MNLEPRFQIARKDYSCTNCPSTINRGQPYLRLVPHPMDRYRGKATQFLCQPCYSGFGLPHRYPGWIPDPTIGRQPGPPSTAPQTESAFDREVRIVSVTRQLVNILRSDLNRIYQLSPEEFELFVCDRLDAMGFSVTRAGESNRADGGIDIIATPSVQSFFPFLLAVQCKHHRRLGRNTGPTPVRELQSVLGRGHFQMGALVTNTTFTADARWTAKQIPHIIRLRDIADLGRWIKDEFLSNEEWRELPEAIELRPGITIKVPRSNKTSTTNETSLWTPVLR